MDELKFAPPQTAGVGPAYTKEHADLLMQCESWPHGVDRDGAVAERQELERDQELVDQAYANAVMTELRTIGRALGQKVIFESNTHGIQGGVGHRWLAELAVWTAALDVVTVRYEKGWAVLIRDRVWWEL